MRSRFRRDIDDDALAVAAVLLARILEEESVDPGPVREPIAAVPLLDPGLEAKVPWRQRYHEEVERLREAGFTNAEAVRQVAQRFGKREATVRQGIYMYQRSLSGSAV